jgi:glycosyltransferase involved in cell wall biosynthesis
VSERAEHVLVLIQGALGPHPAGPEIRGWEMAQALQAAGHHVTAAADIAQEEQRDGIRLVPRTRRDMLAALPGQTAVIGPVLPPYLLTALRGRPCLRIADLYDPVDLELGTLDGWRARREVRKQQALRTFHLRWADVVVCANERQLARTADDLGRVTRPGRAPVVLNVPMGLPTAPPAAASHPLRDHFPGIGATDPLVLWWGSIWRWLDAPTAIEAIGRLAATRPDVRFVITAGKPANTDTDRINVAEEARQVAARAGLLDRHVFFLDEWVPFDARQDYLRDADVGLTLHAATAEAPLAARARYMDYVWTGLPSVLAEGDEVGEQMGAAGAALLVPPGDAAATAAALDRLLGDDALREAGRVACDALADQYRWPRLLAPLVAAVQDTAPVRQSPRQTALLAQDSARFYGRRVIDTLGEALPG